MSIMKINFLNRNFKGVLKIIMPVFVSCFSSALAAETQENTQDAGTVKHGIICLTFDDSHCDSWLNAMELFKHYDAHGTFFFSGAVNPKMISTMKILKGNGHSIGLHTLNHANAGDYFIKHGAEDYIAKEIVPQLDICRKAGLEITNFAYPNNQRTVETDKVLFKHFDFLRAGLGAKRESGVSLADFPPMFRKADESLHTKQVMGGMGIGTYYKSDRVALDAVLERAARNDEMIIFYSHNITPGAQHIHMPAELLEHMLAKAKELNMTVAGFDDLKNLRK